MRCSDDKIFKALADPTRRIVLDELAKRGDQTLYELCSRLIMHHKISMSRQAITKHIAVLEDAGLVKSKRTGKYKMLVLNHMPIQKIHERWISPMLVLEGNQTYV